MTRPCRAVAAGLGQACECQCLPGLLMSPLGLMTAGAPTGSLHLERCPCQAIKSGSETVREMLLKQTACPFHPVVLAADGWGCRSVLAASVCAGVRHCCSAMRCACCRWHAFCTLTQSLWLLQLQFHAAATCLSQVQHSPVQCMLYLQHGGLWSALHHQ